MGVIVPTEKDAARILGSSARVVHAKITLEWLIWDLLKQTQTN